MLTEAYCPNVVKFPPKTQLAQGWTLVEACASPVISLVDSLTLPTLHAVSASSALSAENPASTVFLRALRGLVVSALPYRICISRRATMRFSVGGWLLKRLSKPRVVISGSTMNMLF